jgi:hypothetical protein
MQTTEHLLQSILDELRRSHSSLGFCHPPKTRYIYANRQYQDCLWYFWDGNKNQHIPIEHNALSCSISSLEIEQKEFRGKPDPKVNLHVKADRRYAIQAGFDTQFARGLLYGLYSMPDLSGVVIIAAEAGDTEQVLFCRIYDQQGQSVFAQPPDLVDWDDVARSIQSRLNAPPAQSTAPPTPAPTEDLPEVDALTGQTRLIPDERSGIADSLGKMIKQMGAVETNIVLDQLNKWRADLGENAYAILHQRWKSRAKELNPEPIDRTNVIALIGAEMELLNLSKQNGSYLLQERYSKRTRSELTDAQLVDFLSFLKRERAKQLEGADS